MSTALAVMIAIAGYLNFVGNKIEGETLVVSDEVMSEEEMTALLDLSEEDIASDIDSLDEEAVLTDNYLSDDSQITVDYTANSEEALDEVASSSVQESEVDGTPGEAVFTSTQAVSTLSAAKLLKEQTRAQNKEALTAIMNNAELDTAQKQDAVDSMVELTDISEREMEAEILLQAKGFSDAVVSINGDSADVVVCADSLTDAQLAQIMDIVTRKAQVEAENVIISQVAQN
jgi:stage III sporulation protein AH